MVNEFTIGTDGRLQRDTELPSPARYYMLEGNIQNLGGSGVVTPAGFAQVNPHAHLGGNPYALPDQGGAPKIAPAPGRSGNDWATRVDGGNNSSLQSILRQFQFAITLRDPANPDRSVIVPQGSPPHERLMQLVNDNLVTLRANADNRSPALIIELPTGQCLKCTPLDSFYEDLMRVYDEMKSHASRRHASSTTRSIL